MACDCNKKDYGCSGMPVSSNCTFYEGPVIPLFGICPGDPITYTTKAITDKILELVAEEELDVSSITLDNCSIMKQKLGAKDKTYGTLIQILIDYQCTLTQLIESLQSQIDGSPSNVPYAFTLGCITPVGNPVNTDAIVQGIINKVCALETQVNNLGTNVEIVVNDAAGTFLGGAIKATGNRGFDKTGSASTTVINFYALVPPLCPIPYVGPASNFDSFGKGVVGSPYENWVLLDGQDGRLDARGRGLTGAVKGLLSGGPLDPAVDPTQSFNPNTNYGLGDKFGENYHKPTINEMFPHTHTVNDPGHSHRQEGQILYKGVSEGGIGGSEDWQFQNQNTSTSTTGITISSTGGGDIFNVRQPSLVITGYIMLAK